MSSKITTINPATDEQIATYDYMTDAEARDAVQACHDAFLDWRLKSTEDRGRVLRAVAKELRNSQEDFAQLMTQEVGKLIGDSRQEVELCAQICEFTADNGPAELADEERSIPDGTGVVSYAPIGVIYGIQPWNFPCYQVVRYSVANLMAGNGVLLKHAANCTGSGLFLRDLMEKADNGDEAAIEALDKVSPDELIALESTFSVYDDLKQKLIDRGIPENEIAVIHDANTEAQKEELFGKVRSGRVRFLFGSTAKMGAGTNVQNRLVALHHLDAPWRPSDLEQRDGRGIRLTPEGEALARRAARILTELHDAEREIGVGGDVGPVPAAGIAAGRRHAGEPVHAAPLRRLAASWASVSANSTMPSTTEAAAAAAHVAEDVAAQVRRLEAFVTARDPARSPARAA